MKTSVIRRYPAFQAQRGFWFLQELAPDSVACNVMSTWRIQSRLDVDALQKAWAGVTDRNESFRTTYLVVDGVLIAEVRDRNDCLAVVDATGWAPEELLQRVSDEAHRPFDLERGPVSRATLFTAGPEDHVLLISAHHIAADGWSNRILMKELGALYDAYTSGLPAALPAPGPSCEEFARWQAEQLAGPDGERLWSYWREQLAGELPGLELPADRPRQPIQRHRGASETLDLDDELASALRQLARSHGTTPFVILLAVFQSLLARYTGQNDIVVGSIAHGRTVPRFRRTFGNLMNQIVLRTDLSGAPSFSELVYRTRETLRAALAHQAYPFQLLVERLAPVRDPGRPAVCDVTFSLTYLIGEGRATLDWDRLSLTALPVPRRATQSDLDVQLVKSAQSMTVVFHYDTDLFEAETIRRMGQHYLRLLGAFGAHPAQRIWEASLLDESERAGLIARWTHETVEWDGPAPVEALVEALVDRAPEVLALSGSASGDALLNIGRAIANVRTYVLDARGEPVPIGVAGELWIAGVQVARGDVNRPEETAGPFDADPWVPGERRYRTGDLVRCRADGRLEHIGRLDAQVKIRGYRVELREIETAVESHPAIAAAIVQAPATGSAAQKLVAYLVARASQAPPTMEDLRLFLLTRLPAHMVPSDFILLDQLPVTLSGKVDRRALAAAAGTALERGTLVTPPRTGLEETLAGIWAEMLERSNVGIHDNFFELGGHSLLATQVISRIQQIFQVDLAVRDLFEAPTVAGLAERVAARVGDGRSEAPAWAIEPRQRPGPAPLSFSQERMWFLHQLAPESAAYNVPAAIRVRGPLNVDALVASLGEIVRRHEILRTVFPVVNGRPVQVATDHRLDLPIVDLQMLPIGTREARARELCHEEGRRPFDLERGPVLRALLLRLDRKDHVILLTLHHITCDQWSFRVLARELISLYEAHCANHPSSLRSLPIQFGDFAAWQRRWLAGPVLEAQLAYWRRQLAGTLPALELPADRTRPATPSYEGGWETRRLESGLMAAVEMLGRQERASVFMTLMAAFTALLARYSGQDDIIVGVPIANRNHIASEGLIGDLVNTLPIRTDLSGDPTFRMHLRSVRSTLLGAYAHQDMPFDRLVLEIQPTRYTSHSPLVRVLMNLLNVPMPRQRETDLVAWEPFKFDRGAAQFDLTLTVEWDPEGWVNLEYSSDLFDRATAARIINQFEVILRGALANPDCRLSEIPLLTQGDREQFLVAWNRTAVPGATDTSIHELFEAQVDRTPDAVAVTDRHGSLTYRELDGRANRLAHYLLALGVGSETSVGICLERSRVTFVALLAVLKAGGAFVPLDPSYPTERLAFMLADSGARVLVTERQQVPDALPAGMHVVLLDADRGEIARQSEARPARTAGGDRLAYVIYTSGSTGAPKGVLGLHRGAVNRFRWMWRTYPFLGGEMCCQKTSASFVDSIWETFGPLLQGVPIAVIPDEVVREPAWLIRTLAERHVTRIVLVPSLLRAMIEAEPRLGAHLPHLRLWVSSGEALGRGLARRFREAVPYGILLNLYGSSEAAADSAFHEVEDVDALDTVPIGRPIDNTEIYILDRSRQPVPIGVPGELYVGGDGLARGYLNQPELTAEKFVPNPFSGLPAARMFHTGDRARYRSDGTIEYLGRFDSQVKVRGFRIEIGEVQFALAAHPGVANAVVVAQEDANGGSRLIGYVVVKNGTQPADILEFVRRRLPGHMVPSALVSMDALPLTPNGKVDRLALLAPGNVRRDAAEPPRTATEATLSAIWADLLGVPELGVHDNFFEFGGHSLLAAQLVARIEEVFRTALPLRSLFEAPTVARMAALIEAPAGAGVDHFMPDQLVRDSDRVEIEL
jgi:amino acid adenylation domain-containing protein